MFFKINEKNFGILYGYFDRYSLVSKLDKHLSDKQSVSTEVSQRNKRSFELLMNVGLEYLALSRSSNPFQVVRHNA
jgi:excinuclease ABC subunit A